MTWMKHLKRKCHEEQISFSSDELGGAQKLEQSRETAPEKILKRDGDIRFKARNLSC
jgi:hypothetical protein